MPVHDVEVKPVGARVDGTGGFIADASKVGGEEGWSDDGVFVGPFFHAPLIVGRSDGGSKKMEEFFLTTEGV